MKRHVVKRSLSCQQVAPPMRMRTLKMPKWSIDNMWGILVTKVYAHGRQYSGVNDLKTAISAAWGTVTIED